MLAFFYFSAVNLFFSLPLLASACELPYVVLMLPCLDWLASFLSGNVFSWICFARAKSQTGWMLHLGALALAGSVLRFLPMIPLGYLAFAPLGGIGAVLVPSVVAASVITAGLSHILFGAIICVALFLVLRRCGIRSPQRLFYLFVLFMMEFPDVDHLFRIEVRASQVVPFTFWDLFRWELRTEYFPLTLLHYWIYPFILLAMLALPLTSLKKIRWIMVGAFLGWTTHLVLDRAMLFI